MFRRGKNRAEVMVSQNHAPCLFFYFITRKNFPGAPSPLDAKLLISLCHFPTRKNVAGRWDEVSRMRLSSRSRIPRPPLGLLNFRGGGRGRRIIPQNQFACFYRAPSLLFSSRMKIFSPASAFRGAPI